MASFQPAGHFCFFPYALPYVTLIHGRGAEHKLHDYTSSRYCAEASAVTPIDSLEITEVLNSWIEPPVDGVAGLGGLTVQAHCLISGYSSPTATASDVRSS